MDADFYTGAKDAPIDKEVVEQLRNEGENLLCDLVDMFIVEVPLQLARLEEALTRRDAGATRLTAHTLKCTGGNFGARRLLELANALEEKGRNASLDGAFAILTQFRAECARVREALEAER
jgi:HPt (histidine-containing phosphotransfer) domain-containing protein